MLQEKYKKIIFHPLTIAVIFFLAAHIYNITRFDFLAEKDSYGWIYKYENNLVNNQLDDYRQYFFTFAVTIHYLTGLSIFDIFKYFVPFLFILVFIPLWMLAKQLKQKTLQLLLLLTPLGSATIILQMEATRPQIMAMFFLYFALGMTVLARSEANRNFVFFGLGLITLVGSLFHRVFVIFCLLWIVSALIIHFRYILKNKAKIAVLIFLAIPWMEKFEVKNMMAKSFKSLADIFNRIFIHPQYNFNFPAHYTNVDGIQMGWSNHGDVLKYYAFYAGPFFLVLIGLIIAGLLFSGKFRAYVKEYALKKELLFIYLLISFFLFIAEFLPRIGNLAYLPDRAWVFLGILLVLPLYYVLDYSEKNIRINKIYLAQKIVILFLGISIAGAAYVNKSFANIIPDYKWESYKWIKNNLDPNSVIFTPGYAGALKYHSGTETVLIGKSIFEKGDLDGLIYKLNFNNKSEFDEKLYRQNFNEADDNIKAIKALMQLKEYDFGDLSVMTKDLKKTADILNRRINASTPIISKEKYVYVSKDTERNPYHERNYDTGYFTNLDQNDTMLLDEHPEYFEKVYDTGDVKIWRYVSRN